MIEPIYAKGFHFYKGNEKWLAKGFTYGPFAPLDCGDCYPDTKQLHRDFADMVACGVNCIRLYNMPSDRVVECASEFGLRLIIDIPWPKHLDVFDEVELQKFCFAIADDCVKKSVQWDSVFAILLGNEIPADYVRWHGPRKVEQFLKQMYEKAKSLAPDKLVGFANYPSTEYLDLEFLDFVGFNVYLDNPEELRYYLIRLRHLYPDKPLLLSECGLDSRHHGEDSQGNLVPEYLRVAYEAGMAGAMVFAWTDEWHTGGVDVVEWDFGLVDRDRGAKPALAEVKTIFESAPQLHSIHSKISIVVATYNGGRTLHECMESIEQLHYQNYETIVVDDGSTDDTQEILRAFPWVRIVTQENLGLSAARNAGIDVATGDIVAFTDSDCIVDRDWLYFIALFLEQNPDMAGVGGPNITPLEMRVEQQAVALAPGHATHVLLSHSEAEHVPGCNMAFRWAFLQSVGSFDFQFKKAGDDVDIIWRLQNAGHRIGFSTGAFVWHHRRPTMRGYVKQQIGYGEAESLLMRKHPQRFNDRGQSVWRGVIYPSQNIRPLLRSERVQYGVFGTAGYQCIYHTSPAPWWYYATSLEWWLVSAALLLAGFFSPVALIAGVAGIVISVALSGAAVARRWPGSGRHTKLVFLLAWGLWVLHPLVRSGARYWYRLQHSLEPAETDTQSKDVDPTMAYNKVHRFWCQEPGLWRADILTKIETAMLKRQWVCSPNDVWDKWDLNVVLSAWYKVRLFSSEETHGGSKRLLKIRYVLVPTNLMYLYIIGALLIVFLIALYNTEWARWVMVVFIALALWAYRYACHGRRDVALLAEDVVTKEGYIKILPRESMQLEMAAMHNDETLELISESRGTENV